MARVSMISLFLFFAVVPSFVLSAPVPSNSTQADPQTLFANGQQAQKLNSQFLGLKEGNQCTEGESTSVCVSSSIGTCKNGKLVVTTTCQASQACFALPSLSATGNGVTLACTSQRSAASIIEATGASGGIFGSNSTSSDNGNGNDNGNDNGGSDNSGDDAGNSGSDGDNGGNGNDSPSSSGQNGSDSDTKTKTKTVTVAAATSTVTVVSISTVTGSSPAPTDAPTSGESQSTLIVPGSDLSSVLASLSSAAVAAGGSLETQAITANSPAASGLTPTTLPAVHVSPAPAA